MCVKETGTSAKLGDQNCPIRTVVRPLLRSAKIKRPRICGCSSPNGGTPLNAPKKSNSTVARGAHLPSTGAPVKVKFKRVFRKSPSVMDLSVAGWFAGEADKSITDEIGRAHV